MINKVKAFIKELRYKRFERKVLKEIRNGNTTFGFDGFEFEVERKEGLTMGSSNVPTREQKENFKKKMEKMFPDTTKERQVKFLEETISKLESFKQSVEANEAFIDNATMNCERTAANKEEIGGHNIYINIDYQVVKPNIK